MASRQANRNFSQTVGPQRSVPTSNTPGKEAEDRKRKRSQEDEAPLPSTTTPSQKRPSTLKDTIGENAAVGVSGKEINPVEYWTEAFGWPKEYFVSENNIVESNIVENSIMENNMGHTLARKRSIRWQQSDAGTPSETPSATPSDQMYRGSYYARGTYPTVLATKGTFMYEFQLGITDESKRLCRTLIEAEQSVPQDTLWRDDLFEETCNSIRDRNEAMVVWYITPLICPPAQGLRILSGAKHLEPLHECRDEGWNSAIPVYGPRPQPDYSVGFGRPAFTGDQLKKLIPFVGAIDDNVTTYLMATRDMYLPFLTCEVTSAAGNLEVADRQNAHSMTIAVRGTVTLFRLVKREKELHREILAFSISHDHQTVKIYGHYPVIDGYNTTFYRHLIKDFNFRNEEGKDKWFSYKFTKNVYDLWMPAHLKRIRSAIDELPFDFHELPFDFELPLEVAESRSSQARSRQDTSLSGTLDGPFKKPKKGFP